MSSTVSIGDHQVGPGHPAYVIAEISGNHNGDLQRALDIVSVAAEAGVDAVKLQTYTAASMTIDSNEPPFLISGGTPWDGRRLYELYEEAATPWEWTKELFARGRELGLDVFSTPFDPDAVTFLEQFDPPAYKIASFELVDNGLLRAVAATGRPVVLSTGMATAEEITAAVTELGAHGCGDLVLLRCTSAYPALPESMNLRAIPDMVERWNVPVGLSDHTLSNISSVAAVSLGACMVEKHVTLSRNDPGPDTAFSLEPDELRELVASIRVAESALGQVRYGPSPGEASSKVFRRSLFVVADIAEGTPFTTNNIRSIRPGDGLPPKELDTVLGRSASRDAKAGTPLSWELIQDS